MKPINTLFLRIKSPVLIGVVVVTVALIAVGFASKVLYERTVDLLTENLRERILTISVTAAANISSDDLAVLQTEEDWQKPEWSKVVSTLNRVKYSNKDVVFMYMFRKTASDPSQMEFIADADSINPYANTDGTTANDVDVNRDGIVEEDGPDKLQWPGQPYPEAVDIPEAFEAYNGALTSAELYTDEYGTVLTGYAPIRDTNGNTVAVLATDIKADDFFSITTQTLQPFIIFITFLIGVIFVLAIVIIYVWNRYARFLENTNARLKVLDKQKTEFVSLASHQLRAPMTAIKGYTAMILDGDYSDVPEKLREPLQHIFTSTQSLIQIVSDFLDVTRIELGTMKFTNERFDFNQIVKDVVAEPTPNINKTHLEFKFAPSDKAMPLTGDVSKIKQVLNNLIDNAIEYTKQGWVHVTVEKIGSKYRFMVEDTGVGINPEALPKLFEKFVRAENANEANVIGTGLGLYVAKQMIEKHNGKIWAESEGEGKGSKFIVEISNQ